MSAKCIMVVGLSNNKSSLYHHPRTENTKSFLPCVEVTWLQCCLKQWFVPLCKIKIYKKISS